MIRDEAWYNATVNRDEERRNLDNNEWATLGYVTHPKHGIMRVMLRRYSAEDDEGWLLHVDKHGVEFWIMLSTPELAEQQSLTWAKVASAIRAEVYQFLGRKGAT